MGSFSAPSASSPGPAGDRALLEHYRATVWSVRAFGRSLRVTPNRPLPATLPRAAIVTAYNPASRLTSARANRAAHRALRERLDAGGHAWLPARAHGTGANPRRWDEPAFALTGADGPETALRLAAAMGQNAILAAADGPPRLVAARDGFCGRRVGDQL